MSALALPVPHIRPDRQRPARPARERSVRHLVAVPSRIAHDDESAQGARVEVAGRSVAQPLSAPVRALPVVGAQAAPARLRLTVRGQLVVTVLALVAALGVGSVVGLSLRADVAPVAASQTVTVGAGDNLWSIASSIAAPGQDPREVVADIMALNSLGSATVQVGQELVIPAHN